MDKKIFATLAIATVLASCTSDLDGIDETPANPKPIRHCTAVVDLSVQAPTADATTRTPSGANGPRRASAETADKDTVSLSLPTNTRYTMSYSTSTMHRQETSPTPYTSHASRAWTKTEHGTMCFRSDSIRLEPGDYRVYAVANAPTAAGKIGNDQSLLTTVAKGKSIMSVIGTEGLTMSNRGGSAQNVCVSTDSVTHIEIALERAVAKVEIGKRFGSYELKDKNGKVYAKVTPGSFYFVNLSRDYYLFRHTGKFGKNSTPSRDQYAWSLNNYTDIPDTDGYLIDPHFFDKRWDASSTFDGSTIFDNALTEIVRTGREYEATLFPEAGSYSKSYILENSNSRTAQREGYTTGIIIKGILTPRSRAASTSTATTSTRREFTACTISTTISTPRWLPSRPSEGATSLRETSAPRTGDAIQHQILPHRRQEPLCVLLQALHQAPRQRREAKAGRDGVWRGAQQLVPRDHRRHRRTWIGYHQYRTDQAGRGRRHTAHRLLCQSVAVQTRRHGVEPTAQEVTWNQL